MPDLVPDLTSVSMSSDSSGRLGVVYLTRNLALGGAERVFVEYVRNGSRVRPVVVLRRREGELLAEIDPATPVFDLDDRRRVSRASGDADVTAMKVPAEPTGFTPRSLIELVRESLRLRRIVEATECDLVSSFLMRAHIIALLTKCLLRRELRVVVNLHEHLSESEPHMYPKRVDRFLMRWVVRNLFPRADRIVVVAESLAEDLIGRFGIEPARISVVHNPVHLQAIRNEALRPAPELARFRGRPLVIGVGRLVHLKGFDLLIRAMQWLPAEEGVELALVGDGPERSDLEDLARGVGVADRVHFLGMQVNPWRLMARATVLALPSRTEAFPNVIGEALVLEVPVVAAACSEGVREYLEGGRCGMLVEPNDPRALARAIERVLGDPALRRELAARGRKRMEQFDLPRVVREYEENLRVASGLSAAGGRDGGASTEEKSRRPAAISSG